MIKKISLALCIIVLLGFAQQANAFSITPSKYLVTADPGISQTITLKVKNEEPTDLQYAIKIFGAKQNEEGHPLFLKGVDEAENWVRPESSSITISSGNTKSINFFINVPKGTPAGSHYLGLGVEPSYFKGSQVSLSGRLVSVLILQVGGSVHESLEISKWKYAENPFVKEWKFNLEFKNLGNIEVPISGNIKITNWSGKEVFSENLNLGNQLLSGSSRSLAPIIVLSESNFLPGLYQAQLKISYGKTNQVISAIANIWYLPIWSIILLAVLGLAFIWLGFFVSKKLRKL